jgi:hypothetical protein
MPRREPTVVFHVGAVPTASWLVQQCVQRRTRAFPPKRMRGLNNATMTEVVGRGDVLTADPAGLAAKLRQAFANDGVDTVVASRELLGPAFGGSSGSGLHADADAAISALDEATSDYRRVIVLSVCSQPELLEMHAERALIDDGFPGVEPWLASVDLDNLSWLPLHRKLTDAFGDDGVTVHAYQRTDAGQVALLRAVLAAGGVELPDGIARRTPPAKLRLSETGMRLADAARPHLRSDKERADLRAFLQWSFTELDGPPGLVLDEGQRDALHQQYDGELELLTATPVVGAGNGGQ